MDNGLTAVTISYLSGHPNCLVAYKP